MRDFIYVGILFALVAFLATSFPAYIPVAEKLANPGFASFVVFTPAKHDAILEAARTSWQVRSKARSQPSVGRLDADTPLLADTLPPPAAPVFGNPGIVGRALPDASSGTYLFMPPSMEAQSADFVVGRKRAPLSPDPTVEPVFGRDEMLSIEKIKILKELMQ